MDAGLVPITESQSAVPSVRTNLQPAIITKHVINSNDVKPIDSACVFSTCANLQVSLQVFMFIQQLQIDIDVDEETVCFGQIKAAKLK